jgi:hypothetical protein
MKFDVLVTSTRPDEAGSEMVGVISRFKAAVQANSIALQIALIF